VGIATGQGASLCKIGGRVAGETILIVEDDPIYGYALSRFLQSRGYTTVVADGSMAAFREIDTRRFDLVITDMSLHSGEPHGASLGRVIRNRHRNMPVILVTSSPKLAEEEEPLPGPVFDKSTPLDELERAVKDALAVA
jgi:two-component system, NtrC family, response regulator HydG